MSISQVVRSADCRRSFRQPEYDPAVLLLAMAEDQLRAYGVEQLGQEGIFWGTRPDFDIAVHPSHSENIGGAVESLAISLPTTPTRIGTFPDVVIEGETA